MHTLKILLTFGPASVPMDDVRRITNHSTGSLGNAMGRYFLEQNHEMIALRGEGATVPSSFPFYAFKTNQDLQRRLFELSAHFQPDLLLHAAALSDYEIESISIPHSESTTPISVGKIASHHDRITLQLKPAPKILPQLRSWFPKSTIIGWKYELEGTAEQAITKAQQQILQKQTDYSVINGKAYGEGFGICDAQQVRYPHLNALDLSKKLLTLSCIRN